VDSPRVVWDPLKAVENLAKHGVSFDEAREALNDPLGRELDDPEHSLGEHRLVRFGETARGRLLAVSYALRHDTLRVISARAATRREKQQYERERFIIRDAAYDFDDDTMRDDYSDLPWRPATLILERLQGTVTLDPDVYDVFRTSKEVNDALRMLIREGRLPHIDAIEAGEG
jgi:uncharacterized DUF497 family protein